MVAKEVDGTIKCENSSFGDPLYGTKKTCYCQHRNPSFLDEEIQFNLKIKMHGSKGKEAYSTSDKKGAESANLSLKN
jgi:hypothetical protein